MNMFLANTEIVSVNDPALTASSLTVSLEPKTRKRTRRISFDANYQVVGTVAPLDSLSEDDRSIIWYQQVEIEEFRTEARDLCRRLRENPDYVNTEDVRGLELRTSVARQQRKHLSIRCILRAQERTTDTLRLAAIGRKCTSWSREVALLEGQRDFYAAYYPARLNSIPEANISEASPIPLKSKRSRENLQECCEDERNVRCKIEPFC